MTRLDCSEWWRDQFVLSQVFSLCGAAQLKLMIGWAGPGYIITSYRTFGDKHMRGELTAQVFSHTEKVDFISGSPPLVNFNGLEM